MFVFRKARSARQTLNDLDAYLSGLDSKPVEWLVREVKRWGEFSYSELEEIIAAGRLNELIDWQARYADVINQTFAPMWLAAIESASKKATQGKIILDDSDEYVKAWIKSHGGELITRLSEESRKAVAMVILLGQSEHLAPKEIARQVRPLIGLTERQAAANLAYRDKIYQRLKENGQSAPQAASAADKAATRYAAKQHRFRAETIVHTELAFAYNRGAHMGVSQAISNGLMGRCAMIWSTAGTNRVCGRCLALKDTVVGYTDELGVTLPPLHPRCRCAIIYDEVAEPKIPTKPKSSFGDRNYNSNLAQTIGKTHYDALRDVAEQSPHKKALRVWDKFEKQINVQIIRQGERAYHSGGVIYINLFEDLAGSSIDLPYQVVFHESAHLIDWLNRNGYEYLSVHFKSNAFAKAIYSDLDKLLDAKMSEIRFPKKPTARLRSLFRNKEWFLLREEGFITQDEFRQLARISTRTEAKKRILANFANMTDEDILTMLKNNAHNRIAKEFCDEMKANYSLPDRARLSDIFCGYFCIKYGEEFSFGVSHDKSYWRRGGSEAVAKEAFAEFMDSALANQESFQVLSKFLPTAAKIFEKILDELLK